MQTCMQMQKVYLNVLINVNATVVKKQISCLKFKRMLFLHSYNFTFQHLFISLLIITLFEYSIVFSLLAETNVHHDDNTMLLSTDLNTTKTCNDHPKSSSARLNNSETNGNVKRVIEALRYHKSNRIKLFSSAIYEKQLQTNSTNEKLLQTDNNNKKELQTESSNKKELQTTTDNKNQQVDSKNKKPLQTNKKQLQTNSSSSKQHETNRSSTKQSETNSSSTKQPETNSNNKKQQMDSSNEKQLETNKKQQMDSSTEKQLQTNENQLKTSSNSKKQPETNSNNKKQQMDSSNENLQTNNNNKKQLETNSNNKKQPEIDTSDEKQQPSSDNGRKKAFKARPAALRQIDVGGPSSLKHRHQRSAGLTSSQNFTANPIAEESNEDDNSDTSPELASLLEFSSARLNTHTPTANTWERLRHGLNYLEHPAVDIRDENYNGRLLTEQILSNDNTLLELVNDTQTSFSTAEDIPNNGNNERVESHKNLTINALNDVLNSFKNIDRHEDDDDNNNNNNNNNKDTSYSMDPLNEGSVTSSLPPLLISPNDSNSNILELPSSKFSLHPAEPNPIQTNVNKSDQQQQLQQINFLNEADHEALLEYILKQQRLLLNSGTTTTTTTPSPMHNVYRQITASPKAAQCGNYFSPLTSIEYLERATLSELRCLFSFGTVSKELPLGFLHIFPIRSMTEKIKTPAENFEGTRFLFSTLCQHGTTPVTLSATLSKDQLLHYSRVYINSTPASPKYPMATQDYIDQNPSLWFDFTSNLQQLCPIPSYLKRHSRQTFQDNLLPQHLRHLEAADSNTYNDDLQMSLAQHVISNYGFEALQTISEKAGWNVNELMKNVTTFLNKEENSLKKTEQIFPALSSGLSDIQLFIKSASNIASTIDQLRGKSAPHFLSLLEEERHINNIPMFSNKFEIRNNESILYPAMPPFRKPVTHFLEKTSPSLKQIFEEIRLVGNDVETGNAIYLGRVFAPEENQYEVILWWVGQGFSKNDSS